MFHRMIGAGTSLAGTRKDFPGQGIISLRDASILTAEAY